MLDDLGKLDRATIALGLISGGGSALLVCPDDEITLEQLVAVAQFLQAAGATIDELNAVRSWLCQVKGGGLARACTAGRIETLIISDVVGDDLSLIASGPCQASNVSAQQAHEILKRFIEGATTDVSGAVIDALEFIGKRAGTGKIHPPLGDHIRNNLIATNALALEAAQSRADSLGYRVKMCGARIQGDAYQGGREFAATCQELRQHGGRWCVISGGEPTLVLNPLRPAGCRGGRNQAWALAALDELWKVQNLELHGMAILAGGTDGEDGPCDVAGAVATQEVLTAARDRGLDPNCYMQGNNEYTFFAQAGGHLDTGGGTNTNVGDIHIACINA
jgi:hydroxypyruvate reductase